MLCFVNLYCSSGVNTTSFEAKLHWMPGFAFICAFLSVPFSHLLCAVFPSASERRCRRSNEPFPLVSSVQAPAGRLSGSEVDFERLTLIEPLTPRRRRLCLCSRSVSVCSFTLSAFFFLNPSVTR